MLRKDGQKSLWNFVGEGIIRAQVKGRFRRRSRLERLTSLSRWWKAKFKSPCNFEECSLHNFSTCHLWKCRLTCHNLFVHDWPVWYPWLAILDVKYRYLLSQQADKYIWKTQNMSMKTFKKQNKNSVDHLYIIINTILIFYQWKILLLIFRCFYHTCHVIYNSIELAMFLMVILIKILICKYITVMITYFS